MGLSPPLNIDYKLLIKCVKSIRDNAEKMRGMASYFLVIKYYSFVFFTDKKENQIFLIYQVIQNGAVAKWYMTNGLLIYGEIFAHFLIY